MPLKMTTYLFFIVERRAFFIEKSLDSYGWLTDFARLPKCNGQERKKNYMYPLFSEFFPILDFDLLRHLLWCTSVDVFVIFFWLFLQRNNEFFSLGRLYFEKHRILLISQTCYGFIGDASVMITYFRPQLWGINHDDRVLPQLIESPSCYEDY